MVMPVASITCAPLGIAVLAPPTAVILPFSITTTPFSMVPCVMVSSLPPRSAMVGAGSCGGRGVAGWVAGETNLLDAFRFGFSCAGARAHKHASARMEIANDRRAKADEGVPSGAKAQAE